MRLGSIFSIYWFATKNNVGPMMYFSAGLNVYVVIQHLSCFCRTVPLDTKGGNQGIISLFIHTDCLKYCSKFSVSPVSSVASVKKNVNFRVFTLRSCVIYLSKYCVFFLFFFFRSRRIAIVFNMDYFIVLHSNHRVWYITKYGTSYKAPQLIAVINSALDWVRT